MAAGKALFLSICLLVVSQARAEPRFGWVAGIIDGNTLTLEVNRRQQRVLIAGVDAPERGQDYADQASAQLGKLVFNRQVRVECLRSRSLPYPTCHIWVHADGCGDCEPDRDVGLAMVEAGLAWWDKAHGSQLDQMEQQNYESAQAMARLRGMGLWAGRRPIPPWEWRRRPGGR